ncbi:MAG TPA: SPOR domain-containing protein [Accumulibacter sp.]|nr:SPOR domain-containing protein [Accumulibacter sp.]HQC79098.1 SPOR domain-containing protein [Accumulibacter sp.]
MPMVVGHPAAGDWHVDVKRQLLRRIGVAAALIVTLLAGLALFDYINSPGEFDDADEEYGEPTTTRNSTPVMPVKPLPTEASSTASAPPSVPAADSPSAGATGKGAEAPARALTEPPSGRKAGGENSADKSTEKVAEKGAEPLVGAGAAAKAPPLVSLPPPPEVAARPVLPPVAGTGPAARDKMAVETPAPPPRFQAGFAVETVALPDVARAEEWQVRLAREGIPATVETRLRIGPFRTRAEAENARRKIKALGIETAATLSIKGGRP